ncbi:hypothetical protein NL317_30015, partial [Klebsiella pneumoniae]|nr:hypothetical protein [Klebsiella pneumoniae]
MSTAQGKFTATDLHAAADNSVAISAAQGVRLDSNDVARQNQLTANRGNVAIMDQGQAGITGTHLNIQANQGNA